MNLRKKGIIFFVVFVVLWLIAMQYIIPNSIMPSFKIIEKNAFEEKMLRADLAIHTTLQRHEALLLDWTKWTDAYNFVENPNDYSDDFLYQNIGDIFFKDQKVNYVLVYGTENQLISASGYNFKLDISQKVPSNLIDTLTRYNNQYGLLYLNEKAYIFSKYNVSDSDFFKTSQGSFAFVSELDAIDIGKLSQDLQENIYLLKKFELGKISEVSKHLYDDRKISYAIYKIPYENIDGHMTIKLNLKKDITSLGEKALKEGLFVFTASVLILCSLIYIVLREVVLRIMKLNNDVIFIRKNNDVGHRVKLSGTDELRTLQENINSMLDHIDSMNTELNNHATYDLMTGTLNRRSGFDRLETLMQNANNSKLPLSIAFIDINNLKYVNDTYGHAEGDIYISNICDSIKKNIREIDVLFRLGGDEFLIVFVNCKYENSRNTVTRIKLDINNLMSELASPYDMSISSGIVEYNSEYNITHFIELADEEMYKDKKKFKLKRDI